MTGNAQLTPLSWRQTDSPEWVPAGAWHLWPAILVAYAALMPRELSIVLAGASLAPYRLVLLGVLPYLLFRLVRAPVRAHWIDLVAAFVSLWVIVSLLYHEPLARAAEVGLALALDFGLAYLAGRLCVRSTADFRRLFIALLPGLIAVTAILMVESLAQRHILRPFLAELLDLPAPVLQGQERLGLFRAAGPFPHQILGGVLTATLLPIAWFAVADLRLRTLAVLVCCGMIFTVSTAAIMAFLLCLTLIVVYHTQLRSGLPLFALVAIAAITFVALVIAASESGLFSFVARRLTLSPGSGQWRVLIWQYAGAEALAHPLLGIGLRDWIRPSWMITDSIDAHFLLWSMRFGMPAGIGALVVMLGAAIHLLRSASFQTLPARGVSTGIAFSILAIAFSGFTVALWEGVAAWMIMLSGIAVTIGTPPASLAQPTGAVPHEGRATRVTRAAYHPHT